MTTTVTIEGQVTISKRVRDALNLTPGSYASMETLDERIDDLRLVLHALPRAALFLAGKAFLKSVRRG